MPVKLLLPLLALGYTLMLVLAVFYAERKLAAFFQDRLGPMERGPYGLLQAMADVLKLLQKAPGRVLGADAPLFWAAPLVVFASVFAGFAVVPLWPGAPVAGGLGVFYLLAVISIDAIGIWLAGWASFSKYPMLGALRAVGQLISYEVPLGISVLGVVVWAGSAGLEDLAAAQGTAASWGGIGGLAGWSVVQQPLLLPLLVIYYLCTLAECNRAPFDLPEGESELVGGFHTEYTGFGFALFFLAEYALMVLTSLLGVFLFLGGWHTPLPTLGPLRLAEFTGAAHPAWAVFWLTAKTALWLLSQIWMRWTFPRLRQDQLMRLSWQVLTPAGLILLLVLMVLA